MSRHSKEAVIKPKILICIIAAIVAIALIVVFSIVLGNKNKSKSDNTVNSVNTSQSNSDTQSEQANTDASSLNTPNPKINGVENGKIYYTTQYVHITDDNIKSVTVNGDDFNTEFFLEGNAENMYVIEATDHDNNTTTYIVYTKTIKSLTDAISTLNQYTVTADDLENLESIKEAISTTGTAYSPPEETIELDNILAICEGLINKVKDIQQRVDTLSNDYDNPEHIEEAKNNVSKLASMITDIDSLLATKNLTATQRTRLTAIRAKYSSWLSNATALEPLS